MVKGVATDGKRWPTKNELRAWSIFARLDRPKRPDPDTILDCLEKVDNLSSAELHRALYTEYEGFRKQFKSTYDVDAAEIKSTFTKREKEVLVKVMNGLTNKEIAADLKISVETVKEHVQHLLRKLKVSDRTRAAIWAIKNGFNYTGE